MSEKTLNLEKSVLGKTLNSENCAQKNIKNFIKQTDLRF